MATKEHKFQARGLIEELEARLHNGQAIKGSEITLAMEFLRENDFSAASDYHARLKRLQERLTRRAQDPVPAQGKRNYGGQAGGLWMQVQSAYDHVILSTCYAGEFNLRRGRVKVSHRFNREGRIDFVELKFVSALHPCLNGEIRKLLLVKGYQDIRKDWRSAEAFVLPILPQELIFLYENIFRSPKNEIFAWLVNVGHKIVEDLLRALRASFPNRSDEPLRGNLNQAHLRELQTDSVAAPILAKAALLKSATQCQEASTVLVQY